MTIAEAYQFGVNYLQTKSALDKEEARTKSRLLLDHVAGIRYAHLMQPQQELDAYATEYLQASLSEVAGGRPLPYLLREWEFYGLTFHCDERALIPRPESEILVEAAIQHLKSVGHPMVADLGTGTGCIAVSVAYSLSEAQMFATDISLDALELARVNAKRHHVEDRINFVTGKGESWSASLVAANCAHQFNAILSNPPYIATNEIATLQTEVRDWEPRTALDGGDDGLDCYRHIAAQCDVLLAPDGFLMVELGAGQYNDVREIFTNCGWSVELPIHDLAGIERVLTAHRKE